jgi:hypothetical protein
MVVYMPIIFVCLFVLKTGSQCNPAGLQLEILLPQPSRHAPPQSVVMPTFRIIKELKALIIFLHLV